MAKTDEIIEEHNPVITVGGKGKGGNASEKTLSTPVRYLINAVLFVLMLVIGTSMIDGGMISRYQSTVLQQVGIYIIMAVSLNVATGYLGQLPLGHAGFMSVGG